jgi:hypothetical protein
VQAKIYYEIIQRAQVEADLARAQVDVAKAHVRAVMADIEAGQAEVKVIEAQVALIMGEVEKATLQADVANIYAETMTKQLSNIKLAVGREEISKGFDYIQTKLSDELALWGVRQNLENVQAGLELAVQDEVQRSLVADEAQEDLRDREMEASITVFGEEKVATAESLEGERILKAGLVDSHNALADARLQTSMNRDDTETWARTLVNAAQRYVHKHSQRGTTSYETNYEYISG